MCYRGKIGPFFSEMIGRINRDRAFELAFNAWSGRVGSVRWLDSSMTNRRGNDGPASAWLSRAIIPSLEKATRSL